MILNIIYLSIFFILIYIASNMKNRKSRLTPIILVVAAVMFFVFIENFIFNTTYVAIVFLLYCIIIIYFGKKNYYKLKINNMVIKDNRINEKIKIVFIADLQYDKNTNSFNKYALDNLIKKINEIDYDILLLGGDYINYINHLDMLINGLKKIENNKNIFAVMGNHDYHFKNKLIENFNKLNITTLENDLNTINVNNNKINISGLKDLWMDEIDYEPIKNKVSDEIYHILLLHNPDYIQKIKDEKIDLVLSGHYHQGQVNFIPGLTMVKIVSKYDYGKFNVGRTILYVTSGVGGSYLRGKLGSYIRWNSRPEIFKVELIGK